MEIAWHTGSRADKEGAWAMVLLLLGPLDCVGSLLVQNKGGDLKHEKGTKKWPQPKLSGVKNNQHL